MTNVHTDRSDRGFVLGNKMLVAEVFAKNGFLVLSSDTGEEQTAEVDANQLDQGKRGDDTPRGVLLAEREDSHQDHMGCTLHIGEEVICLSSEAPLA
jgi:hypothetical protein